MIKKSPLFKNQRRFSPVLPLAALFAAIIAAALFLCRFAGTGGASGMSGHLRVTVLDAYTGAPIKDVYLVVPECEKSAVTDANGMATLFSVPFLASPASGHRDADDSPGESTVTLLAYRDGYYPYALFFMRIEENRLRSVPTVYLFESGTEEDITATSFVESPDENYVNELVQKFAP